MLPGQVLKAVVVCIGLAIAFFADVPVAKAALIGGAILLVTRAIKPARIYREIDGPLLFMFAGLFIVVAGAEKTLLSPDIIASAKNLGLDDVWRLSGFTAVLSNIMSNVPAVLALRPFIPGLENPERAWLIVAMRLDAGRQFHAARLGRQSDCRGARAGLRHNSVVRRLLQGRPAADAGHAACRNGVAGAWVLAGTDRRGSNPSSGAVLGSRPNEHGSGVSGCLDIVGVAVDQHDRERAIHQKDDFARQGLWLQNAAA